MRKTRTLMSLLVTIMLAGIVSACSSNETTPQATSAPSSADTGQEQNKYAEPMTISYAVGSNNLDVNDDEFAKVWKDKFNFDWEIMPVASNNNSETFRIWINSGDMADMGSWNYNHSEYVSYVKQGLLKELPKGWRERWPNLAASQDATGMADYLSKQVGSDNILLKPIMGDNYPIDTLIDNSGIWYRADWFRAVGAEVKDSYTISEIMDIGRKIKEQDPGKVGKALVPMEIASSDLPHLFVHAFSNHYRNESQFYQDADGVFHWGLADPEVLEGLKLWRQAYDEGLLHPEFYNLPGGRETEAQLSTAGVAAMNASAGLASVGTRQASFMKANLGVNPEEALNFAIITDDNGVYHTNEIPNFAGSLIFNPKLEDAKFERILDILDYSASPEGQNLINMGIEGVDWEKNADGTIKNLNGETQTSDKYKSIPDLWTPLLRLRDDFNLINPTLPQIWRDKGLNQYVNKMKATDVNNPADFVTLDPDVYFYSSPARTRAVMDLNKELASIVLKGPDVEANWNAWVKSKMPLIQPVLDELTALKKK
ncbi:putative aldouronate transport system substrate-binding protein [Paenibacillus rhizosphaerae]|uniref:Putative aldouronate transport system substrate-binding protein n=1 Tax=Paenibacillus rhizosphaerae TaxID=297318 RepID=A0A839TUP6_9BACL|nr:ABC transporter substrate-binding protein [Paenibacillus rhizosphaerae]MBB3129148.1 putative aldouronate transport system substrate-binding protein [Paenibacillus rhizosphaerae]